MGITGRVGGIRPSCLIPPSLFLSCASLLTVGVIYNPQNSQFQTLMLPVAAYSIYKTSSRITWPSSSSLVFVCPPPNSLASSRGLRCFDLYVREVSLILDILTFDIRQTYTTDRALQTQQTLLRKHKLPGTNFPATTTDTIFSLPVPRKTPPVCYGLSQWDIASFEAHGPWCRFVEYQMSNVEYQTNFTHVRSLLMSATAQLILLVPFSWFSHWMLSAASARLLLCSHKCRTSQNVCSCRQVWLIFWNTAYMT